MEIQEFLELCEGKWFSQRTSYHLEQQQSHSSQSEITIERLFQDHPTVTQLCQEYQIDPKVTLGGTQSSWDDSAGSAKTKRIGSAVVILVANAENPQTGLLLQASSHPQKGRYILGKDEALTLIVEGETGYAEERLWFPKPNLRLRTSLIRYPNGFHQTTFYSEIRRLPPKNP
jgi:hypothetical protein